MWVEKNKGLTWSDARTVLDNGGHVNIKGWNAEADLHETALEKDGNSLNVVSYPGRSILTPDEDAAGVKLADLNRSRVLHQWRPTTVETDYKDWRELVWTP